MVSSAYITAGFETDFSLAALSKLSYMEARLADMMTHARKLPEGYVVNRERERERQRREDAREERAAEAKTAHEERVHKAHMRSLQPVLKPIGRRVMFRSFPTDKRKTGQLVERIEEARKENDFYSIT
eukprot:gnl/Dysnectes_brevis/15071_a36228_86.p1 GENE.gnl/Dysnectes_brevis/15071_a36228_86~~gnl/Dysnectes_brevis/15071_a36228_86.p1  ORF type:complete len:128 (-),score=45.58 gnl/Dysnectes_brevis/15071_a36228_86:89-472(-)